MTKADRQYSDAVVLRRLFREARGYRGHIAGLLVLGLLVAPLTVLGPLPLKIVVDSVLGDYPLPGVLERVLPGDGVRSRTAMLAVALGLVLVIPVLNHVVDIARTLLRAHTGERLVLGLRSRVFRHAQRLSMAHHDAQGTADAVFRIQWDAPAIQHVLVEVVIQVVSALVTLLMMLYVMARLDAELALIALLIAPILGAAAYWFRKRLRPQYRMAKELEGAAHSVLQETMGALRVVKAFGQEEREQRRYEGRSAEGIRVRLRLTLAEGGYHALVAITVAAGTAAVLFVGTRHVQAGILTLGELLLVMSYLTQLYTPLQSISRSAGNLQPSLAGAERVFALLDQEPEVVERAHARSIQRAIGAVSFEDVSFHYGNGRPVLRDVSFRVEPGRRVGISGATGAGKTTLLSLLTRFYDPVEGRILLDGVDLRDYRVADLRNQFSIVLQEPVLFSTSIAENIAYARPGSSDEDIVAAAKAAGADDFIRALPDGYDTEVGERGMQLSGGERQRISLARAFLKDAPILILDEPTSSVDVATERAIMTAMERLMTGRTSFMIAHRLGTLEGCDVRLELDGGRLTQQSAPAEGGVVAAGPAGARLA